MESVPIPAAEVPGVHAQSEWILWQLLDSAFPTGGFAHSGGLEAAWQHGEVPNRAALSSFLQAAIWQLGRSSLPFVVAAFREPQRLEDWDAEYHAFTSNHVANRASRMQGRATWLAVHRMLSATTASKAASDGSGPRRFPAPLPPNAPALCHLPPVFGFLFQHLGQRLEVSPKAYVFSYLRSLLAAAVRLNCIGPMEAQAVQLELAPIAQSVVDACAWLPISEAAQTSPLIEIWQGGQDRLYSRLFQS